MAKAIGLHTDMVAQKSQAINAGQVTAYKADETILFSSFIGGNVVGGVGTSYVTRQTVQKQTDQGTLESSNSKCHLGLQGNGYFLVADQGPDKEKYNVSLMRRGDWTQAVNGGMRIGEHYLLGFSLDEEGIPTARDTSRVDSLEHFNAQNFAQLKPKATTKIEFGVNLNANREHLKGSSIEAVMNSLGRNNGIGNLELLVPERLSSSSLEVGAQFILETEPKKQEKQIEYGGIVSGYVPSNSNKIYGAETVGERFTFQAVASPGQLQTGHELKIVVNNSTTYTFKAVSGSANPAEREFNSMASLAEAINKVSGLIARVDDTLYVGPADPNDSVDFKNGNGGSLRESLGLINNLPAMPNGKYRFNTVQSLLNAVNSDHTTYGLLASWDKASGKIEIGARLATDTFVMRGKSDGTHSFTKAVVNAAGTQQARATISIHASQNNLKEGDYVRIKGLGMAQAPDGIYMVGKADENIFEIYALSDDPSQPIGAGAIADGFPDPAVSYTSNLEANPGKWEKVAAKKEGDKTNVDPVNGLNHQGANSLRITSNGHGLTTNDVVYISGLGDGAIGGNDHCVPDGYYAVNVLDANNFTIISANTPPAGGQPFTNAFTYQKVSSNLAAGFGDASYMTMPITVWETLADDTNISDYSMVKLHLTDHNYSPGDMIQFSDLPAAYTIDNILINNNQKYKIIAADNDSITFETDALAGAAGGVVGKYGDNAANTNDVGFDFKINKFSRMLEYLGVGQGDAGQMEQRFDPRYDPNNPERSLSGTGNFKNSEMFSHVVELINGVGNKYYLRFNFAKLDAGNWAVEIGGVENAETGEFFVQQVDTDGKLGSGIITFDQEGVMQTIAGNITNLEIKLDNNETNNIEIDWAKELEQGGGITQYASPDVVKKYNHNGVTFGEMSDIDITIDGTVIISYDNGVKKKVFQIPLAKVPDPNKLLQGINDTLQQSIDAGDMQIGIAGQSGFAKIICGTLEQSNVERTKELIDIRQLQTIISAIARAQAAQNKIEEDTIAELR